MSSVRKLLSILDLFTVERPTLTMDEILDFLKSSRPQGYRYVRELCDSGLLVRLSGCYALGSRAIELDYIIRESDPLLKAAQPVMREVCRQHGCDVLLVNMVGDRIIAVHHERGPDSTTVSYSRGRLMPLFRGAGSKAILSALPTERQKKLFADHYHEEALPALGQDWDAVRASLKGIRRSGYAVSIGELDPANVGISAPIKYDEAAPPASLVLVLSSQRYLTTHEQVIVQIAQAAADAIASSVSLAPVMSTDAPALSKAGSADDGGVGIRTIPRPRRSQGAR